MEPIAVPAPPKSAFNRNRRVSDLLHSQLRHFQHVAHKHGLEIDPELERDIYTEGGAARYVTAVTRALRNQPQPEILAMRAAPPAQSRESAGLALAAAADPEPAPPGGQSATAATQSSQPEKLGQPATAKK